MKIMVLGVDVYSRGDLWSGQSCFEFMTCSIMDKLRMAEEDFYFVELYSGESTTVNIDWKAVRPNTDLIIYINWALPIPVDELKRLSGAKVIISLLEIPVENMDWSFYFVEFPPSRRYPKSTKVIAPCNRYIYNRIPKKKKIVIDHYTGTLTNNRWDMKDDIIDMTFQISDWLEDFKDEFEIVRMTRFPDMESHTVKPHERELKHCTFKEFLAETDDADIFIQTHTDGYGYGVIDMAARGVRIFSPPHFLSDDLVKPLAIKTFRNKYELLSLVRSKREAYWDNNMYNCTDYSAIITMIKNKYYEIRDIDSAV